MSEYTHVVQDIIKAYENLRQEHGDLGAVAILISISLEDIRRELEELRGKEVA